MQSVSWAGDDPSALETSCGGSFGSFRPPSRTGAMGGLAHPADTCSAETLVSSGRTRRNTGGLSRAASTAGVAAARSCRASRRFFLRWLLPMDQEANHTPALAHAGEVAVCAFTVIDVALLIVSCADVAGLLATDG